ncbi:hypothetical protein [Pararhodospirillum photometricum]|nr:hypothetical protein [Pararhodospirillum photometricum]
MNDREPLSGTTTVASALRGLGGTPRLSDDTAAVLASPLASSRQQGVAGDPQGIDALMEGGRRLLARPQRGV